MKIIHRTVWPFAASLLLLRCATSLAQAQEGAPGGATSCTPVAGTEPLEPLEDVEFFDVILGTELTALEMTDRAAFLRCL